VPCASSANGKPRLVNRAATCWQRCLATTTSLYRRTCSPAASSDASHSRCWPAVFRSRPRVSLNKPPGAQRAMSAAAKAPAGVEVQTASARQLATARAESLVFALPGAASYRPSRPPFSSVSAGPVASFSAAPNPLGLQALRRCPGAPLLGRWTCWTRAHSSSISVHSASPT
jgi:hypothetical protein